MNNNNEVTVRNIGQAIWQRLLGSMNTAPVGEFNELLDLKDLTGASTGSIEVVTAPHLIKMSSLSINMGPGRYFNIHVIPETSVQVPRYIFEGMVMPGQGQISLDLFPDYDVFMNIHEYLKQYEDVIAVYNAARMESGIAFEASRQTHMRSFSSPLFLCTFGLPEDRFSEMEGFAHRYLDGWLAMFQSAQQLDDATAMVREKRRQHMQDSVIALDPDRDRVVAIYGDDTTSAIERASML